MKSILLVLFFVSQICGFWVQEFNGTDGFSAIRIQATGCVHAASSKYYIIGGIVSQSVGATSPGTNTVLIYDMLTSTFSNGTSYPLPQSACACSFVGDNLFVWGGSTGVYRLDLTAVLDVSAAEPTWTNISTGIPPFRTFHSLNPVGTKLYLQGGGRGSTAMQFNDSYVFDTVARTWTNDLELNGGPTARSGSASTVWNNKVYIYGGRTAGTFYNDTWVLDPATKVWTQLNTTGTHPMAKVSFGAASSDGKFFIFSGGNRGIDIDYQEFHYLDLNTLVWTKINDNETAADGVTIPGKRSYYLSWIHNNKLYVALGAYANGAPVGNPPNNGAAYNDVWSIDLSPWAVPVTTTVATTTETSTTVANTTTAATTTTSTGTTVTGISDTTPSTNTDNTGTDRNDSGAIQNFIGMGVVILISMCL